MFTRYLTISEYMSTGSEKAERKRTLHDLGKIGGINTNEESTIELESKIGELRNKLIISGRTASQAIVKGGEEREAQLKKETAVNKALRNCLQRRNQKEFKVDLPQPPGEIGKQRDKFAFRYQDIGDSGIETDADNEARREGNDLGEMVNGPHPDEERQIMICAKY